MMNFILAASDPMQHVLSHPLFTLPDGQVVIDNHILMQVTATVLLLLLVSSAFRSRRQADGDEVDALVPRGSANFFEAICSTT